MQGEQAEGIAPDGIHTSDAESTGPLFDLAARVRGEGEDVAFTDAVIAAAAEQRTDEPARYAALRRALKGCKGFSLSRWERALDDHAREAKRVAKEHAQREARERAAAALEANTRAAAERAAERQRERARIAVDLRAHHAETDDGNGTLYVMEPGITAMETTGKHNAVERVTLARCSVVIVADVSSYGAPDTPPRRERLLSIMCEGDTAPRPLVEVNASGWARGEWLDTVIPARGKVSADRKLRTYLLDAIGACSSPAETHRHRYTGWVSHRGAWVYLHAAGAIGAEGDVPELRAEVTGNAARFAFPAVAWGDAAARAQEIGALRDFLAMEPRGVVVPVVALTLRAALGRSRTMVHVEGETASGKSLLASLAQRCFGSEMHRQNLPCSWQSDTAGGLLSELVTLGDALAVIDEMQPQNRADPKAVLRAVGNAQGANMRNRDGTKRTDPAPRCAVLSVGEVRIQGAESIANRMVTVTLPKGALAPRLEGPGNLDDRAAAGELARGMARFVRWLAPRIGDMRENLTRLERDAAARWNLGTDRAAELFGGLALGIDTWLQFLADEGTAVVSVRERRAMRERAGEALSEVAKAHGEHVADEGPGRVFLKLFVAALAGGMGSVPALVPGGKLEAPANPSAWGYSDGGHPRSAVRLGILPRSHADEIGINLTVAMKAVRDLAKGSGRPFDATEAMVARSLHSAGLLRTEAGRKTLTMRYSQGAAGREGGYLAVPLSALADLGMDIDVPTASPEAAALEVPEESPGDADDEPPSVDMREVAMRALRRAGEHSGTRGEMSPAEADRAAWDHPGN